MSTKPRPSDGTVHVRHRPRLLAMFPGLRKPVTFSRYQSVAALRVLKGLYTSKDYTPADYETASSSGKGMDGWMDYTSLCIDHGPLAGGISATRGGGLPVSTYNPRGAFVSSDHSLLSDNPDMPLLQGRWRFICSRCPSCRGL